MRNTHGSLSHNRYETSTRALQDLALAMQAGQWAEAMDLYSAARSVWQELRKSHDLRWQIFSLQGCGIHQLFWIIMSALLLMISHRYQEELPVFLRSFTTGWAYTRILSRGVEILQRLRHYEVFLLLLFSHTFSRCTVKLKVFCACVTGSSRGASVPTFAKRLLSG